jgi:hypothetical protein
MTAKIMYVWYPMFWKATGVIMTTIKLKIQFADVESALAGARIFNGTISAGYNQVIPNHPIAKQELKTKRKTAAATSPPGVWRLAVIAKIIIEIDMPAAPKSIKVRRPNFSIVNTATHEARKYSVPLQAETIREVTRSIPSRCSKMTGI